MSFLKNTRKNLKKINIFAKINPPTAEVIIDTPSPPINDKLQLVMDADRNYHSIPVAQFVPGMTSDQIKSFPLINEPLNVFSDTGVFVHPYGVPPTVDYTVLWTYFKYTPEIVAVVRALVEDIMSDGWTLTSDSKNAPGYIKKAEKFLDENFAKEQIEAMLFDAFVTGDGYLYVNKLSKVEVKEKIDNILERPEIKSIIGEESKADISNDVFQAVEDDEDIFTPRNFVNVASSTMKAQFDKHGNLLAWIQKVGVRFQEWPTPKGEEYRQSVYTPEEIIHFRLLRLDGKFYGFSPMASVLKEMDILANIKDYARYFFEKGGVPNFMFNLPNETPNSENFKQFKKSLQLFSSLANKYKSLVVTGEVEAKELNRMTKDMQFRELARYLTQILIMTWGVPVARLSDVGLGERIQARGSTIAVEGYYRRISHLQDILEDMLNQELLKPFKVKLKFNKTYIQDEVREVQVEKIKTDVIEQRMALGMWTREQAAEYIGLETKDLPTDKEWEEIRSKLPSKQGWGSGKQQGSGGTSNDSMMKGPDELADAGDKRAVALENMKGLIPEGITNVISEMKSKIDDLESEIDTIDEKMTESEI